MKLLFFLFSFISINFAKDPPPVAEERLFEGANLVLDQDLFYPWRNKDQNYTNGVALSYSGSLAKYPNMPLSLLDFWIPESKYNLSLHSFIVADGAFTPDSLNTADILIEDRPYSHILAFNSTNSYVYSIAKRAIMSQLVIGLLGTDIGKKVQTIIHCKWYKKTNCDSDPPYRPEGWHNQISDGFDMTDFVIGYNLFFSLGAVEYQPFGEDNLWQIQIAPIIGGSLGYYTNTTMGVKTKFGFIRSRWWELLNPGTESVRQVVEKSQNFELFGFVNTNYRLWLYNGLLQGWLWEFNKHDFDWDDINSIVLEGEIGFGFSAWGIGITWSVSARSSEFETSLSRDHYWGRITAGYSLGI